MHTSTWYGYWEHWNNQQPVQFDGPNRLIIVNPGVAELNVKIDIYSNWKEWAKFYDYGKYPPAIRSIGGDPTVGGVFAGDIYFLTNGWRLIIDITQTALTGSLFSDDFETPLINEDGVPQFQSFVSNLVSTIAIPTNVVTGTALTTAEVTSIVDTVVRDLLELDQGFDGTADPSSIAGRLNSTQQIVNTILKYSANRTEIDPVANTLTVFDDDNITPLRIFDLYDRNNVSSTDEIAERIPRENFNSPQDPL